MKVNNSGFSEASFIGVEGKITFEKLMKSITWLRVGGAAEIFFQPVDLDDLRKFLSLLPQSVNVLPIGVCSNLLVRDGGIPGATIRLGRGFSKIEVDDCYVTAGGGALDARVAEAAADSGINLSFLRTIPGTIGGAVKMNAGCYGTSLQDVFVSCEIVTRSGNMKVLTNSDLRFSYRKSNLKDDNIVTRVKLKGRKEDPILIKKVMRENQKKRIDSQPIGEKTGGSTFKNPGITQQQSEISMSAWQLIDKINFRGKQLGGAKVSELHSNFLINLGNAQAEDFESLGELIQEKVYLDSGIKLEWEIKKVGSRKKTRTKIVHLDKRDGK